jgi:hypothetical protein
MERQSTIELEKIDCNCNDCKHLLRDIAKFNSFNHLHLGEEKARHRVNYGRCLSLNKKVSFIPGVCQPQTQECFEHRRG